MTGSGVLSGVCFVCCGWVRVFQCVFYIQLLLFLFCSILDFFLFFLLFQRKEGLRDSFMHRHRHFRVAVVLGALLAVFILAEETCVFLNQPQRTEKQKNFTAGI